jgi:biotin operon repressor
VLYQRSLDIEQRLQSVLDLVRASRYSTAAIAEELGVSVPTVSRAVTALRQRGYDIRAERRGNAWRFVLLATESMGRPAGLGRAARNGGPR